MPKVVVVLAVCVLIVLVRLVVVEVTVTVLVELETCSIAPKLPGDTCAPHALRSIEPTIRISEVNAKLCSLCTVFILLQITSLDADYVRVATNV
jgi:hypothetical protein